MDSYLTWVGGKKALREEIVKRFPQNYEKYIEVFGGAAWVLFHKKPTPFEVYNDANENLYCLHNAVKFHPLELIKELGFFNLNSRQLFNEMFVLMKNNWQMNYNYIESELKIASEHFDNIQLKQLELLYRKAQENEEIAKAAMFYKLIRQSYAAGGRSFSCQPVNLRSTFMNIQMASRRLEKVIIENKDFEALIRHYDDIGALFYCDPPYYETEKLYDVSFPKEDHIRLRDTLCSIDGKFILSYNDCDYIRDLYKDFYVDAVERPNTIALRYDGKAVFKELIIANFDMAKAISEQNSQLTLF